MGPHPVIWVKQFPIHPQVIHVATGPIFPSGKGHITVEVSSTTVHKSSIFYGAVHSHTQILHNNSCSYTDTSILYFLDSVETIDLAQSCRHYSGTEQYTPLGCPMRSLFTVDKGHRISSNYCLHTCPTPWILIGHAQNQIKGRLLLISDKWY